MSRKHYVAIARALTETRPVWEDSAEFRARWDVWFATVQAIATVLQRDNYRFDRGRFVHACAATDPRDMVAA